MTRPIHYLGENDIRAMVRLLGDVSGEQGPIAIKRRQVIEGLAEIVAADSWVWTMHGEPVANRVSHTPFLQGGFDDEQFAAYLKSQEHPDMKRLTEPLFADLQKNPGHLTRLRQQLTTDDALEKSDIIPLFKACDIGPVILSARPTVAGQLGFVVLFRAFDGPLFSERDSRIAHIILSEVAWLFEKSWPNYPRHEVSRLAPRIRSVLTALLQGRARKQIAADFDLSIHTVGGYVKDIYRQFGVNSHAELLCRFVDGDGGDTPYSGG